MSNINISIVVAEDISLESTYSDIVIKLSIATINFFSKNLRTKSCIQEVVLIEISRLNDLAINKKQGDQIKLASNGNEFITGCYVTQQYYTD